MRSISRADLYATAAIVLGATLLLLYLASVYDVQHFYVTKQRFNIMSNDQVGYLTTARWLAETGELRSHLIYPAYVSEPGWRLYMPGIYCVLAVGHILFGDGPIAWRMPSLLSFIVATVGVFLIGRRFYGRLSGVVAALLFALFPPITVFAFTAMPQLPFTAAGVTAFCIFAYLSPRLRPLFVPPLLVIPFLFRETGALLVIPMALVVIGDRGGRGWMTLLASGLAAVALLSGVLAWQTASGKASLPLGRAMGGTFNYDDAFPPAPPPVAFSTLRDGLGRNISRNMEMLGRRLDRRDNVVVPLAVLCVVAVIALVRGATRDADGKGDPLASGAGFLFIAAVVVVTALYTWHLYRGMRAVLFTWPLLAVSIAPWIVSTLERSGRMLEKRVSKLAAVVPAILFLILTLWVAHWGSLRLARAFDPTAGKQVVALMESFNLTDSGVLVAPPSFSLDYVLRHYPIRYSFIPRNDETLRLLAAKHSIQAVIVAKSDLGNLLSERAIERLGLVRVRNFRVPWTGEEFKLFQRPI